MYVRTYIHMYSTHICITICIYIYVYVFTEQLESCHKLRGAAPGRAQAAAALARSLLADSFLSRSGIEYVVYRVYTVWYMMHGM